MTHDTQADRSQDSINGRTAPAPSGLSRGSQCACLWLLLACLGTGCSAVGPAAVPPVAPASPAPAVAVAAPPKASAATSDAAGQPGCAPAALVAMRHRTPVAVFQDRKLALVSGTVYTWRGSAPVQVLTRGAVQVAMGDTQAYALDDRRRLLAWPFDSDQNEVLLDDVVWIAAASSGLLAIRCDGSLWERPSKQATWSISAPAAVQAWLGEAADYYVGTDGTLFARGQADRGQFGDGSFVARTDWTPVAQDAVAVAAHSGHALYLRADGKVLGTGSNRHGALGVHGFGDMASTWGFQFGGVRRIATGSRQSMAIRRDGSLWIWGEGAGFLPRRVLEDVVACSVGWRDSVALTADGGLWQWSPGQAPVRLVIPPLY